MNKTTLNIASVCMISIMIVFVITSKETQRNEYSNNIIIDSNGKVLTKADQYQANILETITEANIKNFKKFNESFEKSPADNYTDGLSKDIFTQYIKYNTSGDLNNEDILKATQGVLKNKNTIDNPTVFSDIKIVSSNVENLKDYANNIATIQNSINKAIISINKIQNKTPYLANIYKTTAEIMIQIEVPDTLSESHTTLINALKKYSEGLNMMNDQYNDPAKALIGLSKVKDSTDDVIKSFDIIQRTIILNKDKLNLTENDSAYTLLK